MKIFTDSELTALSAEANYAEPFTPRFEPDYVLTLINQIRVSDARLEAVKNAVVTYEERMIGSNGAEFWAVRTGDLMEALDMSIEEIEERKLQVKDDTDD